MASLESLTDSEIRLKLTQYGFSVGPVTATTRKVLLKKLKYLMGSAGNNESTNKDSLEYDPRCAVTNFSSGEESDDGNTKNRRKSMPPPKTIKSPRRKSPSRIINSSEPLASSTLVTANIKTTTDDDETTTYGNTSFDLENRARTRHSIGVPDFSSFRSPDVGSYERGDVGSSLLKDSTTSRFFKSPSSDGFRSRLQSGNNYASTTTSPSVSSYQSNQPYSSEFARRLSTLQSSRASVSSSYSSNISSNKLLDVKESDDEDNGFIPYTKFSQSGVKGSTVMQARNSGRTTQDSWFTCDSPISAIIVVFFVLFIIAIGTTYINMHSVDSGLTTSSGINKPLCSTLNRGTPGETCIKDVDGAEAATKLFWIVHKELTDRANNADCIGFEALEPLTDERIVNLVAEQDRTMSASYVSENLNNLKVLIRANPKWNMVATGHGLRLNEIPVSLKCYFFEKLMNGAQWFMKLSFIAAALYCVYRGTKWWMWKNAKYKEEVNKLVTSIIDIVSSKAQEGNGFIPIGHVRDQLIPPMERHSKTYLKSLWNDAVKLLEFDSRLRMEVQFVEGEEFQVWRWLASPISVNKRKIWQGQAFETVEGSVNSLPDSPTAYLKIRHMFDPALEVGEDWVTTVRDAILEKCGGANILHMFVEKQSREGCVYMKCASPTDAGIAYRALHGSWFDSKLVTVKYIREKRYLERFPDSIFTSIPLRPSNDKMNSLQ